LPREIELSDEAELARVLSLYQAGKYSECASEFSALLARDGARRLRDREVIENARIYQAACFIGAGKPELADEPLRAAIRENMQMKPPDSLMFPPPVVERFLRVRQSLYEEIKRAEEKRVALARRASEVQAAREAEENARVAELERLASREVVVVRNRRLVALVPFGVGQFQNGDEGLGWVFLTSEAALAATALTSLGMQTYLSLEASRLRNPDNNSVLKTWSTLLNVSSYALFAVATAGIVQAQVSFVPEMREERYRPLPARLRRRASSSAIAPAFVAAPGELFLGLSGKF
jgi:hypothetical protein